VPLSSVGKKPGVNYLVVPRDVHLAARGHKNERVGNAE